MSLDVKIHDAQTSILRALLFLPSAGCAELQKPIGLTSDHFSFHISRLVELGMVEKAVKGRYHLTTRGKEYANRLDTDNYTIERQPKSAVLLGLTREHKGETQYVFQQRRKNPYDGFWGLPSGKIRWGETILQTAERESLEETGLEAEFTVKSVYHEIVIKKESGNIIEDKIFFVVLGDHVTGELIADFEGGHNEWLSLAEVLRFEKKYDTLETEVKRLTSTDWLLENTITYSKKVF